jgi:hypothetical protein
MQRRTWRLKNNRSVYNMTKNFSVHFGSSPCWQWILLRSFLHLNQSALGLHCVTWSVSSKINDVQSSWKLSWPLRINRMNFYWTCNNNTNINNIDIGGLYQICYAIISLLEHVNMLAEHKIKVPTILYPCNIRWILVVCTFRPLCTRCWVGPSICLIMRACLALP